MTALECSSKGDKRFSAFYAVLRDGRSIEHHYQCDVKGYDPGGTDWRLGKGKPPLNTETNLQAEYDNLWRTWLADHPSEKLYLFQLKAIGVLFTDMFSKNRTPNQADSLYRLCDERAEPYPTGRLKDTDPMPWGKHKGTPMQDVPADYMFFLWVKKDFENDLRNHWNPVAQYIRDNLAAYEKEHPDGIWRK